jgi:hypothetical protein
VPTAGLDSEAMPTSAASVEVTIAIPTMRAILSADPKVRIARDFSHSGVISIAACPTATTGELSAATNAAAR